MAGYFQVPLMWSESSAYPMIKGYSSLTTNGVATFYLTDDGTATGNAEFGDIFVVNPTAISSSTTPTDYTLSALMSISDDKKTVQISVCTGKILSELGSTLQNSPDNIPVNIMVFGSMPSN